MRAKCKDLEAQNAKFKEIDRQNKALLESSMSSSQIKADQDLASANKDLHKKIKELQDMNDSLMTQRKSL